jgi:hypothetical protein
MATPVSKLPSAIGIQFITNQDTHEIFSDDERISEKMCEEAQRAHQVLNKNLAELRVRFDRIDQCIRETFIVDPFESDSESEISDGASSTFSSDLDIEKQEKPLPESEMEISLTDSDIAMLERIAPDSNLADTAKKFHKSILSLSSSVNKIEHCVDQLLNNFPEVAMSSMVRDRDSGSCSHISATQINL